MVKIGISSLALAERAGKSWIASLLQGMDLDFEQLELRVLSNFPLGLDEYFKMFGEEIDPRQAGKSLQPTNPNFGKESWKKK